MEYSMNAVANKMIMVIAALSVLLAIVGFVFFLTMAGTESSLVLGTIMGVNIQTAGIYDAIPFAVGVSVATSINIAKVLLLKRSVNNAVDRNATESKMYLKGQYFLRLMITAVLLLLAGWLHANMRNDAGNPQYVNFMGAFFGIFTFPISVYSMRFFFRNELKDNPEFFEKSKETINSTVNDAIEDLKSIGAEKDK
ncbi:MAG: hypothetical protein LBI27_09020 [Clostridiales bacterium]|jgi:hypothetical protein|nr:hypothetical protein [Clostridiales bacterium]